MSEEIKIEVGEVRRYGENDINAYAVEGNNVFYCRDGAPSAKADRSACKSWCGHGTDQWAEDDPRRMGRPMFEGYFDLRTESKPGRTLWCSPACRDAIHAPLIATDGAPRVAADSHDLHEAERAAKRKAPKAPVCQSNYVSPCSGDVLARIGQGYSKPMLTCDACYLARERVLSSMTKSIGAPYTGPARIDRRLTFQAWDDDFAGDAR